MIAVELSRGDVVEAVIVDPRQPVSAIRIGPDPDLERGFDLAQLILGRFGIDDVEDPAFAVALLVDVKDMRDPAGERIGNQRAGR